MHNLGFVHADIKAVSLSSLCTLTNDTAGHNDTHTPFHTSSPMFSLMTRPVHASLALPSHFLGAKLEVPHTSPIGSTRTMSSLPLNS
jgi:hypothetical protein